MSLSLELGLIQRIKDYCERNHTNPSELGTMLFSKYCGQKESAMTNCAICGANYSERLNECPLCKIKKDKAHEKDVIETDIANIEAYILTLGESLTPTTRRDKEIKEKQLEELRERLAILKSEKE